MKVTILCSDISHPVNVHLNQWMQNNNGKYEVSLVRKKSELTGGDILFLVSCGEIITEADRQTYKSCLVIHASDLPRGKGWSPHIWAILNGADQITVSLLEAENKVDSGRIWKKVTFPVPAHALWDEINENLFSATIELIDFAIDNLEKIKPQAQSVDIESTHYRLRSPEDSRLNPELSISDQFDLIRVCDPLRFPAFFDLHGQRYKLFLEKVDDQSINN